MDRLCGLRLPVQNSPEIARLDVTIADEDEEWDEPVDHDDDGTVLCPKCGESILEAADYCPYCDRWLTDDDRRKPVPKWVIGLVIVLIVTIALALFVS